MKDRNKKGQFIKGIGHPRKRIDIDLEYCIKKYNKGYSCQDISKKFNVSEKTIGNRLREAGIKTRKNSEHTERTKKKISDTNRRKGIEPKIKFKGKTNGSFKKDNKPWNKNKTGLQESTKKGKTHKEFYGEQKANKIRKQIIKARGKQITPVKDTSIEIKLQDFLKQLSIKFEKHIYIKEIKHSYQCDLLVKRQKGIKRKTVIEAYGDYWHSRPNGREIDILRCNELRKKGYRVITLWESEIRAMELEDFKQILDKRT